MNQPPVDIPESIPLEIPRDLHDDMVAHCLREAPLECCGILAGVAPRVSLFFPMRNDAPIETRDSRYSADPRDLIELDRTLRERELNILAIYHSHPQCAAIPSRVDLRENYYGPVPRIIVSLVAETPDVRVWRLDANSYQELTWKVVEPAGSDGEA